MSLNSVCVVGLGYIGLPTAAVLASRRKMVFGVDINQRTVDTINRGEVHIIEPDLDMVVRAAVHDRFLEASTAPRPADAFVIAVPTPFKGDHEPDLSYVEAASAAVASVLKTGDLVILESTSPVGTTEQMSGWMAALRPDLTFPHTHGVHSDVRVAYCPERVLPGQVLRELVRNDRIIGGITSRCSERAIELYKTFVAGECVVTDSRTAEMCKLTENAFRDVNIAFANELSIVCDKAGINVWELIRLANRHPRVDILQPGPGVGGHCIAVDPWFIVSGAPDEARLIRAARGVNDSKPGWVIDRARQLVLDRQHRIDQKDSTVIACFGLAFKANIDDLRESPALEIVRRLAEEGVGTILTVEPNIDTLPSVLSGKVELVAAEVALAKADVVLLLVDHQDFKQIPKEALAGKEVLDTRGLWR